MQLAEIEMMMWMQMDHEWQFELTQFEDFLPQPVKEAATNLQTMDFVDERCEIPEASRSLEESWYCE